MRRAWLAVLLVAFITPLSSICCKGEPENLGSGACGSESASPPVDTVLLAYLSKARVLHHEADLKEQSGDLAGAIDSLTRLVKAPVPATTSPLAETQELLADTYARLADLRGQLSQFDEAEQDIAEGLKRAPKISYFEGHLWEIRGVNEQRRSKALIDGGQSDRAETARKAAFKAFEEALNIQDKVIQKALPDAGGP